MFQHYSVRYTTLTGRGDRLFSVADNRFILPGLPARKVAKPFSWNVSVNLAVRKSVGKARFSINST